MNELVFAFHPRRIDPPHFVAEDLDELAQKEGELIPGEQCDRCGNSCYRIDAVTINRARPDWFATCVTDPYDERLAVGCGASYPVQLWLAEKVVF